MFTEKNKLLRFSHPGLVILSCLFLLFFVFFVVLFAYYQLKINNGSLVWQTFKSNLCQLNFTYPGYWKMLDPYEKNCLLGIGDSTNPNTAVWINVIRKEDGSINLKEKELINLSKTNKSYSLFYINISGEQYPAVLENDTNSSVITYFENKGKVFYIIGYFDKSDASSKDKVSQVIEKIKPF